MSQEKRVLQTIDVENVDKILNSIRKSSGSEFVKRRQQVMIMLLFLSGARLSELEKISIDCIDKYSPNPSQNLIRIPTDKHFNGTCKYRLFAISENFAMVLHKFIATDRCRIVSQTCGIENDTGALLLSEKTGLRLSSKYLFQDILIISKQAGIEGKVSTNMFRYMVHTTNRALQI